jgi:hypothetical protein
MATLGHFCLTASVFVCSQSFLETANDVPLAGPESYLASRSTWSSGSQTPRNTGRSEANHAACKYMSSLSRQGEVYGASQMHAERCTEQRREQSLRSELRMLSRCSPRFADATRAVSHCRSKLVLITQRWQMLALQAPCLSASTQSDCLVFRGRDSLWSGAI